MPGQLRKGLSQTVLAALAAVLLFTPLFVFRRLGPLDFWWGMSANLVVLIGLIRALDPDYVSLLLTDLKREPIKKIVLGGLSAGLLYLVFSVVNIVSRLIFDAAGQGIEAVYTFKSGASALRIGLLMGLLIGPGEELFWRGGLQRMWQNRFGRTAGFFLTAVLYTAVHLGSGNVMLVGAAAVCGLFWGWLYLKFGSALLNIVSHTLWDLAVFLLWPFQ